MSASHRSALDPLVVRLRRGEEAAGREFDELHRAGLARFCQGYLGSREAAEDAVADVFCRVFESRDVPDDFRAWLYRIARNRCINSLRDDAPRAHESLGSDLAWVASATGVITHLARGDERARLERWLEELSPHERELLRLRYGQDLSREEIAGVLDLPAAVVKSRLFEALEKLRALARA